MNPASGNRDAVPAAAWSKNPRAEITGCTMAGSGLQDIRNRVDSECRAHAETVSSTKKPIMHQPDQVLDLSEISVA
jgi:hypothetical protein